MNLVQLEYFSHVAERVSVSAAARAAHVTQPAISKQLRLLEEELGCVLFIRSRNRLALTEEGYQLQRLARDILDQVNEVHTAFNTRLNRVCGRISVGCSASTARRLLPGVLKKMLSDYPEVKVSVEEMDWREAYRKLVEHEIDVAIGLEMTGEGAVVFEPLQESRLVFICAPSFKFVEKKKISPRDLAGVPFVAFPDDNLLRQKFKSAYPLGEQEAVVKSRYTETVMAYVRAGIGVGVVPEYLIAWTPENRGKLAVRELDKTIPIRFGYNTNRNHVFSLALRMFLERLKASVSRRRVSGLP